MKVVNCNGNGNITYLVAERHGGQAVAIVLCLPVLQAASGGRTRHFDCDWVFLFEIIKARVRVGFVKVLWAR